MSQQFINSVEDGNYKKPDLFELEAFRSKMLEKIYQSDSALFKLSYYLDYISQILQFNNPNVIESFLIEILDDYVTTIKKYEVWGNEPAITKKIFEQVNEIKDLKISLEYNQEFNEQIDRIERQWIEQTEVLNGDMAGLSYERKAYFPLINNELPNGFHGILDSVTIKINKATNKNKFIIVPSEKEIEQKISDQCINSWNLALILAKKYIKKAYQYHEVIISFDKRSGFYEGNSLGTALTLSFLEEILKFYNPTYLIDISENCSFTGGVTENGEITKTGEQIIKRKLACVFFSEQSVFVVPKNDEDYANLVLKELNGVYPKRKLKIIGVENIEDVLDRRNLVNIKKQKVIVRTGKFVKKNWISAVITVVLAIIFGYVFVMDFDDNPANLSTDGNILFIKNKSGRTLWTKKIAIPKEVEGSNKLLRLYCRVIDINDDGYNEVLINNEEDSSLNVLNSKYILRCYDKTANLIWKYQFTDKVNSKREILEPNYTIYLVDTLTFDNKRSLYLISCNWPSFASAIYRVELRTGKRLSGTVWCSGHTNDAILKDINNDSVTDILTVGIDNGFEQQVVYGFEIDTTTRVRPTRDEYLIKNYDVDNPIVYIRIPKTDYTELYKIRFVGIGQGSLLDNPAESSYRFAASVDQKIETAHMWITLGYNLKDIGIIIDGQFRVLRDSLVSTGLLYQPFTDTEEYKEIIKNKILFWNDGNWKKRNEFD